MKTRIAIVTMLLGLFIAGTAFAGEPVVPSPKEIATKAVAEFLQDEIDYPAFASETNLECSVLVDLNVKKDGSFTVNGANCKKSCCMRDIVVKAIEKTKNKDLSKYAGENVVLKIDFKLYK